MDTDGLDEGDRREELSAEELLSELTIQEVAEAWIRYHRAGPKGPPLDGVVTRHRDWWAVERWMPGDWWSDEDRVREGILAIVDLAATDDDFGIIGAAIMEVFITDDESRLAWVEEHAAASESFRRSLANIWIYDDVTGVSFARVETAAGSPLVRPKTPRSATDKLFLRMLREGAAEPDVIEALCGEGMDAVEAEASFNRIVRPWIEQPWLVRDEKPSADA